MSVELIGGGVALILTLCIGAAGWFGRQQYGAEREKRKQAVEDARGATEQLERRTEPVADDRSYGARLRRQAERLARLRDRAAKR